jgi:hypothetical protein
MSSHGIERLFYCIFRDLGQCEACPFALARSTSQHLFHRKKCPKMCPISACFKHETVPKCRSFEVRIVAFNTAEGWSRDVARWVGIRSPSLGTKPS